MRQTSIESFHKLKDSGVLSIRERYTLDLIRSGGPIAARNLPAGCWKRLAELRRRGCIEEAGTKIDHATKRRVILWRATNQEPLVKMPTIKKPIKTDPIILSSLYDKAFEAGIRHTLAFVYQGNISEEFVSQIMEVKE